MANKQVTNADFERLEKMYVHYNKLYKWLSQRVTMLKEHKAAIPQLEDELTPASQAITIPNANTVITMGFLIRAVNPFYTQQNVVSGNIVYNIYLDNDEIAFHLYGAANLQWVPLRPDEDICDTCQIYVTKRTFDKFLECELHSQLAQQMADADFEEPKAKPKKRARVVAADDDEEATKKKKRPYNRKPKDPNQVKPEAKKRGPKPKVTLQKPNPTPMKLPEEFRKITTQDVENLNELDAAIQSIVEC